MRSETPNPSQSDQDNALVESIAWELATGVPQEEIRGRLIEAGIHHEEAINLMNAMAAMRQEARKRNARGSVVFGLILVAIGVGVSVGTYLMAAPGGVYVVTWGVVLWGLWKVGVGVNQLFDIKEERGQSL